MSALQAELAHLLSHEARLLDESRFAEWIDLYTPDCLYWMPAWREDGTLTQDPDTELSMIFYRGRRNLEDRVKRLNSGHSVASNAMTRVTHMVTNVILDEDDNATARTRAAFLVNVYDARTSLTHNFFGSYRHAFRRDGEAWKISEKIIHLQNEVIPTMLDIYSI
ncbi:aromatic-ring-hydroxylating dioxygenase subunit beta [Aurantiacibacter xanthus]|uniref:Aromatic-ring-hydroxylating dioxygenase subunit beta n=1 Tax=Aurantiacibacter xanthus TaxID=1784712 RepID=A0A3A1P5Z8_9SPHN|nr:aromatic-ring-hydroxylating dioxygenase subunit beta [Aurantiacibacter xanthus]RIV82243.1 aromatic-ring-hydroxylating dioxygenase subunit beta [Aurantiacibacter xanthus]